MKTVNDCYNTTKCRTSEFRASGKFPDHSPILMQGQRGLLSYSMSKGKLFHPGVTRAIRMVSSGPHSTKPEFIKQ